MNCVVCSRQMSVTGETLSCECGGTWVAEIMLARLFEKHGRPNALWWKPREGARRPCPMCKSEMTNVWLGKAELDRCEKHGIWFDMDELADMLASTPDHVATADRVATADPQSGDDPFDDPFFKKAAAASAVAETSAVDTSESSTASTALGMLALVVDILAIFVDD
jgi:Zn-finger nucleic acid-binding protein